MKATWFLACASLTAVLTGCGRKTSPPGDIKPAVSAPVSPRGPVTLSDATVASVTIPDKGDPNAALQQLTQALRDYVVRTRTVPKSFEEFAAKSQAVFPPPPSGKKYVLKGQEVVLK